MAIKLKIHTKILLAVSMLAIMCAASWHLGLKHVVSQLRQPRASSSTTPSTSSGSSGGLFGGSTGPVGSADNPLKVSIVSWHGYAPGLIANGSSLKTQADSVYASEGVSVEFLLQDDIPPLAQNFAGGIAHCSWRTIDFFAQEQPALHQNQLDAKIVMVVDNSRGSDAIIAKGDIKSVEDLAGKSIGLVQFTPSHMVLQHALEQSSLTQRKKDSIAVKFIGPGTADVRGAFEAGHIDAAVLWEPDTSLALRNATGTHVVFSTKTATNLIYDVMVCDSRIIEQHPDAIQKFVTGWMKGVDIAEKDRAKATSALVATEPLFAELLKANGESFMTNLYEGVLWTGLKDNIRVMGLGGETNYAERIYTQADHIWRGGTGAVDKSAPIIAPKDAFDYRFIKKLADADTTAQAAAKQPEFTFSTAEREQTTTNTEAQLTKPVSINFSPGSAELSKRAMKTIDTDVVPLLDAMGNAYFSIEGNTDSTGSQQANKRLSLQRAEAVVAYLVKEWEYPGERFKVGGNGPDKPLCVESKATAEGLSLDECQAANRRTDIAVYGR